MTRLKLLLYLFCFVPLTAHLQNLINNGSFEYGGSGVGFVTDGSGYNLLSPPFSGNSSAGNYAFITNPNLINTQFFVSSGDHTTGTGKMMVIDGTTTGGQQRFWKAGDNGGGICNLVVGQTYTFSYWIKSVSTTLSSTADLANIGVQFNNASNVSLTMGTAQAPNNNTTWMQVKYTFKPTNACVNIEMFNNNTNAVGNDFAIDDITLFPPADPLDFTYSITQPNCTDPNSGLIAIYPRGGIPPYIFQIQGGTPIPITNTTGIFQYVSPGTYTIGLKDANGVRDSVQNIVISTVSPLIITPGDTTVCPNTALTFTASGGGSAYTWTSAPFDNTMTVTNQPTINVSPNNTTLYTVNSTVNSVNMIFNGDFELGNEGFDTEYKYYNPNNPTGAQRAYGVVSNSSAWYNSFGNCIDFNPGTGTGKMMVVDGSTYNVGNDILWRQVVAVEPNKDYQFRYRLQTVSAGNNAKIEVRINGVVLGQTTALSGLCSWDLVTQNWNAGNNLTAVIELVDREYAAGGNDFAIDDIQLRSINSCAASVMVTMKTEDPNFGFTYPLNICLNSEPVVPTLDSDFPTGGIFNSVEQGLNINPANGVISANGSSPGTYQVTYGTQICGVFTSDTQIVVVRPLPGLLQLTGGDFYCEGQSFNPLELTVQGTPPFDIFYNIDGAPQNLLGVTTTPVTINIGNTYGVYDLDSISDAYCSNVMVGSQTINLVNVPVTPIIAGDSIFCKNGNVSEIYVTNVSEGTIRWYSDASLTQYLGDNPSFLPNNQTTTTYYATNFNGGCESSPASFTVTIEDCPFIIPSGFTPNNDGTNDTWNIIGLDAQFPENVVIVFNRWGEELYRSTPGNYSQKPWDGKYKNARLPVATYYYVIQRSNDNSIEPLNGIVSIISTQE